MDAVKDIHLGKMSDWRRAIGDSFSKYILWESVGGNLCEDDRNIAYTSGEMTLGEGLVELPPSVV